EPARSAFERVVIKQLVDLGRPAYLVRGVDGPNEPRKKGEVRILDNLDRNGISALLSAAEIVICRPGYSSIMDLAVLGRKAILVPTPGQPEQEYLAIRLKVSRYYALQNQDQLDLEAAISRLNEVPDPRPVSRDTMAIQSALQELTS
ncbi:MAG: glycosyltransferase, partial [Saprospiraceae bacterium]|nr:glycosyltransferase [Saprospiraceae bacterium]